MNEWGKGVEQSVTLHVPGLMSVRQAPVSSNRAMHQRSTSRLHHMPPLFHNRDPHAGSDPVRTRIEERTRCRQSSDAAGGLDRGRPAEGFFDSLHVFYGRPSRPKPSRGFHAIHTRFHCKGTGENFFFLGQVTGFKGNVVSNPRGGLHDLGDVVTDPGVVSEFHPPDSQDHAQLDGSQFDRLNRFVHCRLGGLGPEGKSEGKPNGNPDTNRHPSQG